MALRVPGKGNFKPVKKPVKPPLRRPPVAGPSGTPGPSRPPPPSTAGRPGAPGVSGSAPPRPPAAPARPDAAAAAKDVPAPSTAPPVLDRAAETARSVPADLLGVAPRKGVDVQRAASPKDGPPAVSTAPEPQSVDKTAGVGALDPAVPNVPSVASAVPPTGRSATPGRAVTPGPSKSKPLLAAAALAKSKPKPPPKTANAVGKAPIATDPEPETQSTVFEFDPTQVAEKEETQSFSKSSLTPSPARRSTPIPVTQPSSFLPPSFGASQSQSQPTEGSSQDYDVLPPAIAITVEPPRRASALDLDAGPPAVVPVILDLDAGPPAVTAAAPVAAPSGPSAPSAPSAPSSAEVEADQLATASTSASGPSMKTGTKSKRKPRAKKKAADADDEGDQAEGSASKSTKRRAPRSRKKQAETEPNDVDMDEANGADGADDELVEEGQEAGTKRKRGTRGKYGSRGKAGTAADKRAKRSRTQLPSHPELDGVEEGQMVGDEVNPSAMTMKDLATTFVSQGRVSARALKLHTFQRSEEERKRKERETRSETNWRRRQVVRRKHRQIKNQLRAARREEAKERGEDPNEVVSDDSADSAEEFDVEPDRLTPPGSPVAQERIAPVSLDRPPETVEVEDAAAPLAAARGSYAEEEDIEGLGFTTHYDDMDEDEDMGGDIIEGFQLPVEDDGEEDQDQFAGLEYGQYTGGYLDEEGRWVENTPAVTAAMLQQRAEENRRRILAGEDDRQVEVIDNETQFVNSATWGKKVANERWTLEETELFFTVIRETGENYSLMKAYFPGRTVKQLKNKGLRENKVNPTRMNDAIMNRKPMDKQYLTKASGLDADTAFDREREFLDEVAREKELSAMEPEHLEVMPEEDEEFGQTAAPAMRVDAGWNLEFGGY